MGGDTAVARTAGPAPPPTPAPKTPQSGISPGSFTVRKRPVADNHRRTAGGVNCGDISQHVPLRAVLGGDRFEPGLGREATHPADEAWLRVIVSALKSYNATEDAAAVRDLWDRFVAHQLGTRLPEYDLCYPHRLLEMVAQEVVAQFRL